MAELKGGTTIGGYTALHSGLANAYLGGNLTINGVLNIATATTSSWIGGLRFIQSGSTNYIESANAYGGSSTYTLKLTGMNAAAGTIQTYYNTLDDSTGVMTIAPSTVSGTQVGLILKDSGGGGSEGLYIRFDSGKGPDMARIGLVTEAAGSGGDLVFYTNSVDTGSPTERLRINSTGVINLNNNILGGITQINGQYGTIAKSVDEWLRLNDDGSHTSGIYLGSSVIRTDGQLQVGSSGSKFLVDASGNTTTAGQVKVIQSANNVGLTLQGTSAGWASGLQLNNTTASTGRNYGMYSDSGGSFHFVDSTAGSDRMVIDSSGNMTLSTGNMTLSTGSITLSTGSITINKTGGQMISLNQSDYSGGAYNYIGFNDNTGAWKGYIGFGASKDGILHLENTLGDIYINTSSKTRTKNNTLDDGTGNVTTTGKINVGTGIQMNIGNIITATDGWTSLNAIELMSGTDGTSTTTASGYGLVLGAGGLTIIGAGESRQFVKDGVLGVGYRWTPQTEKMVIASDNEILFFADQNAGFNDSEYMKYDGGTLFLNSANTHLQFQEAAVSKWHQESVSGTFNLVQTGTNKRLTIDTSGNTTIYQNIMGNPKAQIVRGWYQSNGGNFTTLAADGWYRIGQCNQSGNTSSRAYGRIVAMDITAGRHDLIDFTAGMAFNQPSGANIHMLGRVKYASTETFGAIRILYATTYDPMYLEIFGYNGMQVMYAMESMFEWYGGWEPLDWVLTSTVPTGYTDFKMEMQGDYNARPKNVLSGTSGPPSQGSLEGDIYIQY